MLKNKKRGKYSALLNSNELLRLETLAGIDGAEIVDDNDLKIAKSFAKKFEKSKRKIEKRKGRL
jgi:hypothetical protein